MSEGSIAPDFGPLFERPSRDVAPSRVQSTRSPVTSPLAAASDAPLLVQADAVAFLESLPDQSVDLAITDPAYESLEHHRAIGTTTRLKHSKASSNDWFQIFPNARFPELFREFYRVLRRDSHLYLFCDQETMFVAKPAAEAAGFKFWKPLVWDKCIAPDTPVWTTAGVRRASELRPGDRVATPDGRDVAVLAARTTRAPALRLALSDGTSIICASDHRLLADDGRELEASSFTPGTVLAEARVGQQPKAHSLPLDELIDETERVLEFPDPSTCLFCGREFDSSRAAAAHQARFCDSARSKDGMAESLGIGAKRLRRWMSEGRLPATWARELGIANLATGRSRLRLQNDSALWFPDSIPLEYGLGKLIGLYGAEGYRSEHAVMFSLHEEEKHLRNHIARVARSLGLRATLAKGSEHGLTVTVSSKLFSSIVGSFVGGTDAVTKYLTPRALQANPEFLRGIFDGLLEGDGHWSHEEQRETYVSASLDLACFVQRFARQLGYHATMSRFENDRRGGWKVRFDPASKAEPLTVASVESAGELDLIDIAIDDPGQLYVLGNGAISHNCRIGMGYHYRSRYEFILFFEKGKRKLHDLGIADVIAHPRVHRGYPAEKPPEVSSVLITQSSDPGDLVIDPFLGSGSVGVAATSLGRRFAGSDLCDEALRVARARLGSP
jgi:DNA modification methylase